ncbi:glycosyltransferase family 2 protein, partial [Candidatus Pelagibacter sp.]|uniref:glycosyltransferase family 2 protein n=1 Tax=Candidatus Pelagibacter sp. TaxID=2024849 RepID=UPI003F82642F
MSLKPILSICIPVFNRKEELLNLLDSIVSKERVEVIIVDDGSIDGLEEIIHNKKYIFELKYFKTLNRGRSSALADAIKFSSGQYILIMDSDDYFLPDGIENILKNIKFYPEIESFLFGIQIITNGRLMKNLPPNHIISNFIKLRADYKVKGDMKEVVSSNIIKKCIYDKSYLHRRTPTSLIWESVSRYATCLTIANCVIVKHYNPKGMSANIDKLIYENPRPMYDLNLRYLNSGLYNSRFFRLKSKIQVYRYSFHINKKIKFIITDFFFIILGFLMFGY